MSTLSVSPRGTEVPVRCWRLDGGGRTAVLASFANGCPALVHFGATLPADEDMETLARCTPVAIAGGQLDPVVPLTLVPLAMDGWQGSPGLDADEPVHLQSVEADDNGLTFHLSGAIAARLALSISEETGLLRIVLTPDTVPTGRLGLSLPVPDAMHRIIDHSGRWCGEFRRQERVFSTGAHLRQSHEGRTGHAHFPGIILAEQGCTEMSGACLGVTLAWSGGHRMLAEEIPDGRRHVQTGFANDATTSPREIIVGWSGTGFNTLSQAMQAHVTAGLPMQAARAVHYNCWEAIYFDHDLAALKEIADRAAALGAERFVLDDGWFRGRNDDTTSLGDWTVDAHKYPDGLDPLIEHVVGLGMQFGIWVEPEMVNIDSDLYRAHPDWVLGPVSQPSGRGQFVLDLSRTEVEDHLFEALSALFARHRPSYVKWDHNRILTGGAAAQTDALYRLLDRLNAAFPAIEIESCASGGGRIDYGILKRTTRVWLSDSNDALERLRMQFEASRWLPPLVQGSHVGPRTCHTSGRVLPMAFRAWVAASRHMGFEMDPRELTIEETHCLKTVVAWYKANRDFLAQARHHRLECHDDQVFAEQFVARDNSRFVLFRGQAGASAQIAARSFALADLSADALYDLRVVAPHAIPAVLNQNSATRFENGMTLRLSGAALMAGALRLPNAFPASMLVVEGERIAEISRGRS